MLIEVIPKQSPAEGKVCEEAYRMQSPLVECRKDQRGNTEVEPFLRDVRHGCSVV